MKIVFCFPFDLSDCIMATPAIKAYKEQTGNFVGLAILRDYEHTNIFGNNPYVDEVIYIDSLKPHLWMSDPSSYQTMTEEVIKKASGKSYDKIINIIPPDKHRIEGFKDCFQVQTDDVHPEVFITDVEKDFAEQYIPKLEEYGFVHSRIYHHPFKSLIIGFGVSHIAKEFDIDKKNILEVGTSFNPMHLSLGCQFWIMKKATRVCLANSVFYQAACAMDMRVDYVLFKDGQEEYEMVKPLHKIEENVFYE